MSPEEISAALDLRASKSWRAGDPHEAHRVPGKKRDASFWCIESRIARDAEVSLEDHVKDVLDQLAPRFEVAASLSKKHRGLMELIGYFHLGYPGIGFESSTIQRLAALAVEIDCDFYHLTPEEEPNQPPEPTATGGHGSA
ncbi:MAG TPA: DUF4279 domain-containing protein [Opitutaceae bacterium]|nr:DUF4279 domain-containing protein [Opitutaceae bacterium]